MRSTIRNLPINRVRQIPSPHQPLRFAKKKAAKKTSKKALPKSPSAQKQLQQRLETLLENPAFQILREQSTFFLLPQILWDSFLWVPMIPQIGADLIEINADTVLHLFPDRPKMTSFLMAAAILAQDKEMRVLANQFRGRSVQVTRSKSGKINLEVRVSPSERIFTDPVSVSNFLKALPEADRVLAILVKFLHTYGMQFPSIRELKLIESPIPQMGKCYLIFPLGNNHYDSDDADDFLKGRLLRVLFRTDLGNLIRHSHDTFRSSGIKGTGIKPFALFAQRKGQQWSIQLKRDDEVIDLKHMGSATWLDDK